MKCSGCGEQFYCDAECQAEDWKGKPGTSGHKLECKRIKARQALERKGRKK